MLFASPSLVFRGVPGFFRGSCRESAANNRDGYSIAGSRLLGLAVSESGVPYCCEADDWLPEVKRLLALIEAKDDDAVLQWFLGHYPRCMALIPKRRRDALLRGIYMEAEDIDIDEDGSPVW